MCTVSDDTRDSRRETGMYDLFFVCVFGVLTDLQHLVAFSMYDLDGNGFISKEEMAQIMDSFYKLVGPLVTFSGKKYESPASLVDEFFDQMDVNKDGKISMEEYKNGALKNPDIIQGLKLFA